MSSISCWTSATRCSNSSVSHPTSNSYPSTFAWSIHRWRDSSPLSILSALHLPASPSIRDSADRCVCWVRGVARVGWVRGFNWARRRHFEVDVTARTRDEPRAGSANCYSISFFSFSQFVYPLYTRWPVPLSALYLTSTSPTRHAPRRSRDLPRHTPSQASNDVQCHIGKGHPGDVQEVHG